jgi:hypothetical protein
VGDNKSLVFLNFQKKFFFFLSNEFSHKQQVKLCIISFTVHGRHPPIFCKTHKSSLFEEILPGFPCLFTFQIHFDW